MIFNVRKTGSTLQRGAHNLLAEVRFLLVQKLLLRMQFSLFVPVSGKFCVRLTLGNYGGINKYLGLEC